MLVIPAIDLRQGKCVRLTQGRKDAVTVYDGDPVQIAESFARAGAQMIHVVDLDAAFSEENSNNREALGRIIRSINVPVQMGGGLRSMRAVEQAIALGVTRVVVGTVAAESIEELKAMVDYARAQIVVGIDAKAGQVVTRGWEKQEPLTAVSLARRVAEIGVERIVYTDVQRDGMLTGPNIEQTCRIATESKLKVTASGGVSSLEDLKRLKDAGDCGIDSVIVGKAFYEGRFSFPEALQSVTNS
ncbi:MAG TPA: 1-(5-phosphoribosyl)-5-[(5-phosphoribosylamino)methylideneamino]imidazole-4-carboxamide isomerase [Pyrinomonadaceae bacterium]|jgi:phosphoribosylformimino-5-aminoimidazole carboxamide ribotide isomerase|nr:1-(5-phosphoribosyl)-5-[(5-phosphoribosylamino)methylideneamino]imidazole-4-carboxamide isomerase [Pyrinomonadaceae bacterium]